VTAPGQRCVVRGCSFSRRLAALRFSLETDLEALKKDRSCPFPPIRLNPQKGEPRGTVFDGQDKLKLVTHCHDWDSFEQNVLEEYLVYRIYNQLTDVSFRVQLVEITYLDTGGENDPLTRMGFLIENEDAMASRVGGRPVRGTLTRMCRRG